MFDFHAILCSKDQQRLIASYPIRFQRMLIWYSIELKFFSDDLTCIDEVHPNQVILFYPTKSGVNGAMDMVEAMNHRFTYDFDNHDFEVAQLICIGEKKRIQLRWCDRSTHLSRDYLKQRGKYV